MNNEELVRAACKALWSDHDLDKADDYYAADFVAHYSSVGMPPVGPGPEGVKELARGILESFPDYNETVEDLIADGDRVSVRLTIRGTNTGPLSDGTTTGKPVEFTDMTIVASPAARSPSCGGSAITCPSWSSSALSSSPTANHLRIAGPAPRLPHTMLRHPTSNRRPRLSGSLRP